MSTKRLAKHQSHHFQSSKLDLAQILRQGAGAWNAWREKNPWIDIELRGAVLAAGTQLRNANLQRARLHDADLRNADLRGADLQWAKLISTNLEYANLEGADLRKADLFMANLKGANLRHAKLDLADMYRADLTNADFSDSALEKANSDGAIFDRMAFTIYVSDDSLENAKDLSKRVEAFLKELGIEPDTIGDWEHGSWFRTAIAAIRNFLRYQKVQDRAKVAENILYGERDLKTSVEITEATLKLVEGLKNQKGVVAVDAGLFLFLKMPRDSGDEDIFVKRLSVEERAILDSDPSLLANPPKLLDSIKNLKRLEPGKAVA